MKYGSPCVMMVTCLRGDDGVAFNRLVSDALKFSEDHLTGGKEGNHIYFSRFYYSLWDEDEDPNEDWEVCREDFKIDG